MSKSIEDMYKSIIDGTSLFEEYNSLLMDYPSMDDDDEMETFLTEDDIEKNKKKLEREKNDIYDIQPGDGTIEEDVHFKRYTKRREHKYTEKEMEEIRNSCEATIVHDYGEYDIYHMSEEDRKKNDMLSEISIKLGKLKRTYSRVDEYIEAMRTVFEAWDLLEKSNYIHTKDEFYEMIREGHIVSNRIIMPKLRKIDSYNIDLIIQYISNPELNPKDLVPLNRNAENEQIRLELEQIYENYKKEYRSEHDEEYKSQFTEEELEENDYNIEKHLDMEAHRYAIDRMEEDDMVRLLSPDETQYMIDNISDPEEIKVENINRKMIKNYDKRSTFNYRKKNRKKRKNNKNNKYVIENLHDILNKIQMNTSTNRSVTRSYMLTHNMFNYEQKEETVWDLIPYFDGSWADENAAILYDINLREELLNLCPEGSNRYTSYGDLELRNFFKILENNGINTVDLRTKINGSQKYNEDKEQKERKKENKKIENAIIQRITNLNSNPKFKKLVNKAEKALNKQIEDY